MKFSIEKKLKNSLGRAGILETPHGVIHTPAFVAVGTKASVKALTPEQVSALGGEVILANTYHLYLQPGDELVREAGGLHKFMNWSGPTMTDSGGFQVFSLGAAYGKEISKVDPSGLKATSPSQGRKNADSSPLAKGEVGGGLEFAGNLAKIDDNGVYFKSHLDGSIHYITPEKSIQIQHNLGADIIFAFDEATSPYENHRYQEEAMLRTHAWAKRSLAEHKRLINSPLEEYSASWRREVDEFSTPSRKRATPQEGNHPALFGIVQGGLDPELRKKSAEYIGSMPFEGFGIGGSYNKEHMERTTRLVNEILPEEKPRHLLGIGEPEDLFMGVENGVDLFDCVAPTRLGRNGTIYTKKGKIIIMNTKFRNDFSPIEEDCECYTCKNYTRSYVAHLFHGKEMLAGTLASTHNLYFIVNLVKRIRTEIVSGDFHRFRQEFFDNYKK